MTCRECGMCSYTSNAEGLAHCRLHNKTVRYWMDSCADNDGALADNGWMDDFSDDEEEQDDEC